MFAHRVLRSVENSWVAPTNSFVGVLRMGRTTQGSRSNEFGRATHTAYVGIRAYMRLPCGAKPFSVPTVHFRRTDLSEAE